MVNEVEIIKNIPQPPLIDVVGGQTIIIPFKLPESGSYELIVEQIQTRQDFTLRSWISEKPLDDIVLNTWQQRNFTIPKVQSRVWLSNINPNPDLEKYYLSVYKLSPNKQYYLNVKNLENALNGFEIAFIIPGTNIINPAPSEVIVPENTIISGNDTTVDVKD